MYLSVRHLFSLKFTVLFTRWRLLSFCLAVVIVLILVAVLVIYLYSGHLADASTIVVLVVTLMVKAAIVVL